MYAKPLLFSFCHLWTLLRRLIYDLVVDILSTLMTREMSKSVDTSAVGIALT